VSWCLFVQSYTLSIVAFRRRQCTFVALSYITMSLPEYRSRCRSTQFPMSHRHSVMLGNLRERGSR
jgi:hypothetical protein